MFQQKKAATRPLAKVTDKSDIKQPSNYNNNNDNNNLTFVFRFKKRDCDFSFNPILLESFQNYQLVLRNPMSSILTVSHSEFSNLKLDSIWKFGNFQLFNNCKLRGGNERWLAVDFFFFWVFSNNFLQFCIYWFFYCVIQLKMSSTWLKDL